MSLKENSDRELRKYCLEKSLGFFSRVASAQEITTVAEHFFQYIKYGPDGECDHCVEPDGCGPNLHEGSMAMLRQLAEPANHIHPELKPA